MGRTWVTLCAVLLAVTIRAGDASAQGRDPVDAAIGSLRRAITEDRAGTYLEMLRGLAALRDQSLRPFFERLAAQGPNLARIEAVIGLAQLDPDERVDVALIRALPGERLRLHAINRAAALELMEVEQLREMLAWDDLEDAPRIAIMAELLKRDEKVDAAIIERIATGSAERAIRGIALCLLAEASDSTHPLESLRASLAEVDERQRAAALTGLLADIGQYKLRATVPWIEEVLATATDWNVREAALAALLQIEPATGLARWRASLAADAAHIDRVRHGLLLFAIAAEQDVPADVFELVRADDDLTERIADAGGALASGEGRAEALKAVLNLDHSRTAFSAMVAAESLPEDERAIVCEHAIARVESSRPQTRDIARTRGLVAIRAVKLLAEIDPARACAVLGEVKDDSITQQMILLGLLEARPAGLLDAGRALRRIGVGYADALAVLVIAAAADALSAEELRDLAMVASGGAGVADAQLAQAAWLYIKHAGQTEQAMASLFEGAPRE